MRYIILKTAVGVVAKMTKALKMREKIAKYTAAAAIRCGEDRFCDFLAQIRRIRHLQQIPTAVFRIMPYLFFLLMASSGWTAALPRPGTCGSCHVENFREWRSSAHARSISGDGFRKALKEHLDREGTDEGGFCFRCHAPELIISGNIFEATKKTLNGKAHSEGVTCIACHTVESVKNGKAIYDPGDFPGYHRVKDLRTLDRAGLCTTCHSVYKQHDTAKEEKRGFIMRNVSKVAELFHAGRHKKSGHAFSDAVVAEKEGKGCPGIKETAHSEQ